MTVFTLARHLYFLGHVDASHTILSYFLRSVFVSFHLCLDLYFPLGFLTKSALREVTYISRQATESYSVPRVRRVMATLNQHIDPEMSPNRLLSIGAVRRAQQRSVPSSSAHALWLC
jgi:hypothetical protein